MRKNAFYLFAVVLSGLMIGLTSCGDDSSSGVDTADCSSLSIPTDLAPAQVSTEYFNNQNVPTGEEYENYQMVKSFALSASNFSMGFSSFNIITGYLSTLQLLGIEPEVENGNCVWEFDPSQFDPEANDVTVRIIGSQSGGRTNWKFNITGDVGDEDVDDFTLLDGFTSDGGSSGEWRGYDPENPGNPVYVYTWSIESEQVFQLDLEIESGDQGFVTYERDGAESNNMTFNNGDTVISIFWNEEDDSGWYEEQGEDRKCYADFENTTC